MKKYYKFWEMILALREEYNSCREILNQLKKYINIEDKNANFYFTGLLSNSDYKKDLSDRRIKLYVEKKYLDILKKIQYIKYNWYSQFLYSAYFIVEKKDNGLYKLDYENVLTPVDGKKYIPKVEIIYSNAFLYLIDELLSSDLMQLKRGFFSNNNDNISLDFGETYINTSLGDIAWDGIHDNFKYSITKHYSPALIEAIFSLEIPVDKISHDWLKLLEKHENDLDKEILFDSDIKVKSKKGILYISNTENNRIVKILQK